MSKITLEITEVVNGVSITETPITLVGDTLSAAASTTATGVTFTPAGGIAATNVQAALAEVDSEKLSLSGGLMTGAVRFTDNQRIQLGTSYNFQMYHETGSNNSFLRDFGLGDLIIQASNLQMLNAGGESYIQCTSDGSVALYHNNIEKATTTSLGLNVNGKLTSDSIDVNGMIEFSALRGTGIAAVTTILDEDTMSSNSDTALATQQSIKAYVDNQVAGKDNSDEITEGSTNLYFTDARADARADARIAAATTTDLAEGTQLYFTNTRADARIAANLIDEDGFGTNSATRAPSQQSVKQYVADQTANIQGDITKVTAGFGITGGGTTGDVGITIDNSVVVTKTGAATMTNKTLNVPTINTADINGGTIDGTVIGGTTPAAGNFTSLEATGQVTVEGSVPSIVWNDTDGNERSSIFHTGGVAYYTSTDSDETFGQHRFRRDTQSGAPINIFETFANGDVKFYGDDGTSSILKTDAVNGRVGVNNSSPQEALDVTGKIQATELINTPIGTTTPSTGKFTSLTVLDDNPILLLNDSDGNEQFKISHTGGSSFVSSFGSGSNFGAMTFYRNKTPIDAKAAFKFNTNGDFIIFQEDGSTNLLKTDADQNRVGINTGSPKADLQVGSSTAPVTMLLAGNNGSANSSQLLFGDNVVGQDPYESGMGIRFDSTANALHIDDNHNSINNSRFTIMRDTGNVGINTSSPGEKLYVVGTARATQFKTGSSIIREDTNKTAVNWEYTGKEFSVAAQEINPGAAIFGDNGTKLYVLGTSADRVQQYSVSSAYDLSSTVTHVGQSNVTHGNNPQDVLFSADGSKIWTLDGGSDQLRYYTLGTNWDITSLSSSAVATRDFRDNADTNPTGFRFNADGTKIILVGSSSAGAAGKDIIYSYNLSTPYDITGIGTTSGNDAVAPDVEVRFDSFTDSLEMGDEISSVQAVEFSVDGKTAHIACRDRRNIVSFALATAFDITTMSFAGFANTVNEELGPTGIHLTESANVAIVVGLTDDTVVQYTVNNPGTVIDSSGSTQVTGNLGVYKNATFEKDVYISGRLRTAASIVSQSGLTASGNVAFNTLGGTVKVGGTSSTGVYEFGRSTKTQTIEISAGTTENGQTNTVNIGNGGASGSATNINIGGGSGTCTVKLANLPTHDNEAAAVSAGLAQDTVYKTSTGELRIKL